MEKHQELCVFKFLYNYNLIFLKIAIITNNKNKIKIIFINFLSITKAY